MSTGQGHRRLFVLCARDAEVATVVRSPALAVWDVVTAESSAAAALLLQNNPCHALLLDQTHYQREGLEGLAWLARNHAPPIVFLADGPPTLTARAYDHGASLCLPRQQVLEHPQLLTAALERAAGWLEVRRQHEQSALALDQCNRQVDRLVTLLWQTGPLDVSRGWYTHRHMLERLGEEVARARRHDTPLTIALGEISAEAAGKEESGEGTAEMVEWTASHVVRQKRRSDVAGQYGLQGFMILMAHTPPEGGVNCCRRLQRHLEATQQPAPGPRGPVRTYFGLATFSSSAFTPQRLLRFAEERLDAAKRGTTERVVAD